MDRTARVESKTTTVDKFERKPARSETHARPTAPLQSTFAQVNGSIDDDPGEPSWAGRRAMSTSEATRASRTGWDRMAETYLAEHGPALGVASLLWGPEGLREDTAGLLGELSGQHVLEVGCGGAQGSRYVRARGAVAVGVDLSGQQLLTARALDHGEGVETPVVQADALRLPFRSASFDSAFSAHGAVAFVAEVDDLHVAVARVLRPGGGWVFSVSHPIRWCFPDDPGPDGLAAVSSYWDETPYVELAADGRPIYAEHHRTIGHHIRALRAAGFTIEDIVEPEWNPTVTTTWGGWSPLRGAVIPGTAVFVARRA